MRSTLAGAPTISDPGSHWKPALTKAPRADNGTGRDMGLIHHHRIHTDHRILADDAAVQDGAMADVAIPLDHRVHARKGVHHTGVLDVRSLLEDNPAKVAP